MNLYVISQHENQDYDTYDSLVVCASDEDTARKIHPSGDTGWTDGGSYWCSSPDLVTVQLIGEAAPEVTEGVVLSSFNAG